MKGTWTVKWLWPIAFLAFQSSWIIVGKINGYACRCAVYNIDDFWTSERLTMLLLEHPIKRPFAIERAADLKQLSEESLRWSAARIMNNSGFKRLAGNSWHSLQWFGGWGAEPYSAPRIREDVRLLVDVAQS